MTLLQTGLARAATATGYQISRSLRFNSADSANLSRTPASAGNRKIWTWSGWAKRGKITTGSGRIFATEDVSSNQFLLRFDGSSGYDTLLVEFRVGNAIRTSALHRDPSAWYHIVVAIDTTQATASNRVKLYVNGVQITAFSTATYPALNDESGINATQAHYIGTGYSEFYDGYLADVRFIDGQALTPSSFGETDSATGVWVPKAYTGTYGTNGFWLKFDDNSGTTSTTLGKDSSGNSNNWTPNNFSVTAGAGNDSLVDSPTNYGTDTGAGGEVRGNYATLNPLSKTSGTLTLTNGNLQLGDGTASSRCNSTMQVSSGKWYFEVTLATAGTNTTVGIGQGDITSQYPGQDALSYAQTLEAATKINNNTQPSYGVSLTTGDVFQVAFDLDNNKLFFGKNGTWMASSDPVSGANPVYTLTAGTYQPIARPFGTGAIIHVNFGQRPFAYTAPSGFKALCTTNLPTPTIGTSSTNLADDYFNVVTYTGTGSSLSVTGVGFQPDLVWVKGRSGATDHALYDAVRGVQKQLESNTTTAETTETTGLTAFGTDGFTVGSLAQVNTNAATYVGWAWKANGAGVSNTAGSLTSTVSANQTAGVSVVTYTIPSASATIETFGHGLGRAPSMVILKVRGNVDEWTVYNANLTTPLSNWLTLNTTAAAGGATSTFSSSSTTFGVRGTRLLGSGTSGNILAYCFAEVAGFSRFGSYTGNGSTDGPFVYCGFRPRYVMIKRTDAAQDWVLLDTSRDTYNQAINTLYPNLSNAENTTGPIIDILSNGFKLRIATGVNVSTAPYIFAAFAEAPFNYARAR